MSDNIEADADGVNTVTADEVLAAMRRVSYTYLLGKREAEVQAIVEDALGFDDFTGKLRRPIELTDAERVEAFDKLNAAAQGTLVQGYTPADQAKADEIQARIIKINTERAGEAVKGRPTVALEPSLL